MNTHYSKGTIKLVCALSSALFLSLTLPAQQALPAPVTTASGTSSASDSSSDSEIVILSPFEVTADKDVGFVATTSLAGGRLAGSLATTPVSYSVQTREFIDALQLTNFSDALEWAPNTATRQDNGQNEITSGTATQVTMRGISANGVQRNFFPLNVNFDSYNLDRYDYARGPNSVLFGYGSFGGTPNIVTKQAMLRKTLASLSTVFSSNSYFRATADINVPLGKAAAVRVNGLWHDSDGWRDFEFEKKKAIDVAGVYRINKTTIRGEAEIGQVQRNNPMTMIIDKFTGWDGKTTYANLLNALPANSRQNGTSWQDVDRYVYNPGMSKDSAINTKGMALTLGGRYANTFGGYSYVDGNPLGDWQAPFVQQGADMPMHIFDVAEANSYFRFPGKTFAVATSEPTVVQDFRVYTATIDQQVGKHLFFQLAGNYSDNKYHSKGYMHWRGLYDTYIDINENLPDGSPNPNFLKPYNQGARVNNDFLTEQYDLRAAAAYVLNGTKWGNFSLSTMFGKVWQDDESWMQNYAVKSAQDRRLWAKLDNAVYYRYYWDESYRPQSNLTGAYNRMTGNTAEVGWVPDISNAAYQRTTKRELTYIQAAFKADILADRVHILAAVRNDKNWQRTRNSDNYNDYATTWDGRTIQFAPDAPSDYFGLTYVPTPGASPIPADTRPRNGDGTPKAAYLNDRFKDDYSPPVVDVGVTTYTAGAVVDAFPWMSVIGNYGTSYNPNIALQSLFGTLLPPQESSGFDVGLRFSLLKKRLTATFTYYEGKDDNQTIGISPTLQNINKIIDANAIGDDSATGMNIRGLPSVSTMLQDVYDRENQGIEFESVANLTRNWRMTFNVAFPKSFQTNYRRDTRAYLAKNDAVLRQILNDAGVVLDPSTNVASVGSGPISVDAATARDGWNALQTELGNFVEGRQLLLRQNKYLANIFTDYTFPSGPLKNFRMGAGVNFRGKQVIGYKGQDTMVNPNDPTKTIDDPTVDAYDAVYNDSYYQAMIALGYEIVQRKYSVRFDFKITNLFDYDDPIYYSTVLMAKNKDFQSRARVMTPTQFYNVAPRTYTLTITIKH